MKSTPDDDIFVVKFDGKFTQAEIWEIYKTSFSQPLIVNNLGTWSEMDGLNSTTLHKYERRKNLMVGIYEIRNFHSFFFHCLSSCVLFQGYKFKCATWYSNPYISDMIPIGDPSKNLFQMYGMYAEIFENLQVIIKISIS